ncbi:MAG: LysM peptidoglycan-binding domain-containing protein [Candidatus Berkelbacteria bacterium]|nr:LysM peptidoglycan-binding domain-containing protein [Candidatus Berkelbacteria bacterium]
MKLRGLEAKILPKGLLKSFHFVKILLVKIRISILWNRIRFINFNKLLVLFFRDNAFKASYISLVSIVFLAFIVLLCNFNERTLAASFMNERYYTQIQVESFVTLVSQYTPTLEEEPTIAADAIALDGSGSKEEYLEKPELATTIVSPTTPGQSENKPEIRTQFVNYTVESGDTLSVIAKKYNISTKTLASVNDLSSVHQIKPGQSLTVPPSDGVVYTVARGDTLSTVVKKYQGNLAETKKYVGENIKIGQKIVIVGGKEPQSVPRSTRLASSRTVVAREGTSGQRLGRGSSVNGYPWGWCTWYAASRRNIPVHWGNAGHWLSSAKSSGYATGSIPQEGAIIVTRESMFGHVGYVESASGNSVTISEMNYSGWGVVSRRTISKNDSAIKGYIY